MTTHCPGSYASRPVATARESRSSRTFQRSSWLPAGYVLAGSPGLAQGAAAGDTIVVRDDATLERTSTTSVTG